MARNTVDDLAALIAKNWKGDPQELGKLIAGAINKLQSDRSGALGGDQKLPAHDGRDGPPKRVGELPDPKADHKPNPSTPSSKQSPLRPNSQTPRDGEDPQATEKRITTQGGLHRDTMEEAKQQADQIDGPPKPSDQPNDPKATPNLDPNASPDQPDGQKKDAQSPDAKPADTTKPDPSKSQAAAFPPSTDRPKERPQSGDAVAKAKDPQGKLPLKSGQTNGQLDPNQAAQPNDQQPDQVSVPGEIPTGQPKIAGLKAQTGQPQIAGQQAGSQDPNKPPLPPKGEQALAPQKDGVPGKDPAQTKSAKQNQKQPQQTPTNPHEALTQDLMNTGVPLPQGHPSGIVPGTPVQLLRPPESELPPAPPQGEMAVADTRRGMALGLTFIPYNDDDLVMRKGLKIYDEMKKDDQVKACLLLKKCSIIGPGWDIEPTDNHDPAAIQLAVEVKEDLLGMKGTFHNALMNMLTAFEMGFSCSEIVWSLPEDINDRIRIKAVKTRAPHDLDFEMDPHGNVTALLQQQGVGQTKLMYSKFVHLAYRDEYSNPYGRSDLREAHRPWWMKKNFLQWWAIFAEKLSDPPIIATHPTNAGKPQVDKVLQVLEHIQARTAMTIPDPWKVDLLESMRDPKVMFESAVNFFDLSIARAMLVPDKSGFAGSGDSGGSYALSKTQMSAFQLILEQTARWLEANVQEQLINRLV